MTKRIALLGATGSIGTQTLEVLEKLKGIVDFELVFVACSSRGKELYSRFADDEKITVVSDVASGLKGKASEVTSTECLNYVETYSDIDLVINGIGGLKGVEPSVRALEAGCALITANKESLVAFGMNIVRLAKEKKQEIIPLDSEHSAIYQCLLGENKEDVTALTLTASGGAFRDFSKERIAEMPAEKALEHPNWKMGKKVTVDCATLMNKGLELIEARNLFGIDNVKAVIHRESVVHGAASFKDGSLKLYASRPDMRIPVAYALTMPKRTDLGFSEAIGLKALNGFEYTEPDYDRFPCLKLAEMAMSFKTDRAGAVLTSADEVAVDAYIDGKISFYGVSRAVEDALGRFASGEEIYDLDSLNRITSEVKEYILRNIGGYN